MPCTAGFCTSAPTLDSTRAGPPRAHRAARHPAGVDDLHRLREGPTRTSYRPGDGVAWNTSQGTTHGTVVDTSSVGWYLKRLRSSLKDPQSLRTNGVARSKYVLTAAAHLLSDPVQRKRVVDLLWLAHDETPAGIAPSPSKGSTRRPWPR